MTDQIPERLCPCGFPQSYPIPHEHDRTQREQEIIEYYEAKIEEAKEQGREIGKQEMIDWSDDFCIIHGDADERIRTGRLLRQGNCYECWQSLKSREGGK